MINNILILGGSGYLGTSIVKRWNCNNDCKITIGDLSEPVFGGQFVHIDMLDKLMMESTINEYDLIINCTGQITSPINKCFDINTKGIDNLVEAVRSAGKKVLHISTVAVYGTSIYADESSSLNPETPYATCKAIAEYKIKSILSDESFCILRLTNLYGENQAKGLFAYLIKSYLSNRELDFNHDGSLMRYFLNINDCAEAVWMAIRNNLSGIYNMPTIEKYSVKEIIQLIEKMRCVKFKTSFEQTRPVENIDIVNFDAFRNATGFEPKTKLTDFINQTFL